VPALENMPAAKDRDAPLLKELPKLKSRLLHPMETAFTSGFSECGYRAPASSRRAGITILDREGRPDHALDGQGSRACCRKEDFWTPLPRNIIEAVTTG